MHEVDQTTEQMVRSVLAYAENRLRMNPVPQQRAAPPADELYDRLDGLIRRHRARPTKCSGCTCWRSRRTARGSWASSRRRRPRRACCSTCWRPAPRSRACPGTSGAIAAENSVLRVIAREPPGLPATAPAGAFVSGGSAGNLFGLSPWPRRPRRGVPRRRWPRSDAHSSIVNTLRLLEMDALVVDTPDHRLTAEAVGGSPRTARQASPPWCVPRGGRMRDHRRPGRRRCCRAERGWWFHVDGAYGGSYFSPARCGRSTTGSSRRDSFILDPHKWLFTPFDCCALLYRDPQARATHTQDASS